MHVRGELAFGAIAQTGRAQASQNTYEHIITTNVCSVRTPYVTLIVALIVTLIKRACKRVRTKSAL